MAKNKKETSLQIRDLAVQYWKGDENGKKSLQEIANLLKRPKSTIQNIIEKYKKTGSIENIKGRGRKPTFLTREKRAIVKKIKLNPKLCGF